MVKEATDPLVDARQARLEELEATLESLRQDAEVMHVLLGFSSALAEVRTLEETLDKTVRLVAEVLGADRCFAVTLDRSTGLFSVNSHAGYDEDHLAALQHYASKPGGLPLMRSALSSGAPVLVDSTAADGRMSPEERTARATGAYIGIPLVRWGEDLGGLGVEYVHERRFEAKDVALARGLSRQIGVALSNARRFNLLQGLRTFGLRIARTELRPSAVTREIAAGAVDLLSGDGALVAFLDAARGHLVAAGGQGIEASVLEQLALVDATQAPFDALLRGETFSTDDLSMLSGIEGAPSSMVGAPIQGSEGSALAAVLVFFDRSFLLSQEETDALEVLATQSAVAIENAQRFERQRQVARKLQEALLFTDTERSGALHLGAVYEAASSGDEIGGDFYDVFDLHDGRIGVVVGDVSGKGAEAAALTAMAKYMLRAFASRDPSPASVLYHLNNALVRGFEDERFTTLAYLLLDHSTKRATLALAGHPPPMIYRHASDAVEHLHAQGGLLGVFENQQFANETVDMGAEDVLLVFTDGLIEVRHEQELYGRKRVESSFLKHVRTSRGQELARAIYDDANLFGTVADDTVILTLSEA